MTGSAATDRDDARPPLELSVVIPAYNEASRIGPPLESVRSYLQGQGISFEILVMNDGSTDGTEAVVRTAMEGDPRIRLISSFPNRGKGSAVRNGLEAAAGAGILVWDADGAAAIEGLERARRLLRDADVVIGSRRHPEAAVHVRQPRRREVLGQVFTWLANRLLNLEVTDVTCGFKLFRREAGRALAARMQINDWSYDAELLAWARCLGLRVSEAPVAWSDVPGTRVRLLRDVVRSFTGLLRVLVGPAGRARGGRT